MAEHICLHEADIAELKANVKGAFHRPNCYVAYLYKNGGLIETISSAGLTSRDVALVTGDTLTVYSKGFNSSTDANDHFAGVPIFAICLSANLNTYPVS